MMGAGLSVVVLEKGAEVGAQIRWAAVVDPIGIDTLLPSGFAVNWSLPMVAILAAVRGDGIDAVDAACQGALDQSVCSAALIIDILARPRDPAPAVTILTPDALRLRHWPD